MNATVRRATNLSLRLDEIILPDNGRPYNATDVNALARSIEAVGLQVPLTCIERLERRERRGADLEEVSGQVGQKSEGEEVSAQVAQKRQGGRPESGDSLAARKLGISRREVQRAQTINALSPEAKQAAVEIGLDDNQSALLEAAKAQTPAAQVETLKRRSARDPQRQARPAAGPLRNLENISAGELARWLKSTTPNDRPHVIRVLEEAAAILRYDLDGVAEERTNR